MRHVQAPDPLSRAFFARSPIVVAEALLGTLVCHRLSGDGLLTATIEEVEAYFGPADLASHARAGRTARTRPMFGPPGHAYVYRLYGVHWAFNVVAHEPGEDAGAVLVRAVLPVAGVEAQRLRRARPHDRVERLGAGPGRVCQALGITGDDSGRDLTAGAPLWIAPPPFARDDDESREVLVGPRVNVAYAGEWADRPYRLGLAGSPALSRPFVTPSPDGRADSRPARHHRR
ncbi:MAG: DNA-3-methyladenine glycosylase [Chloroflexi bacterium]|nr:DNA-3-methyladenine glycosylase [Chloroflexota bacterium]